MSAVQSKITGMQRHQKYDALWEEKPINKN